MVDTLRESYDKAVLEHKINIIKKTDTDFTKPTGMKEIPESDLDLIIELCKDKNFACPMIKSRLDRIADIASRWAV